MTLAEWLVGSPGGGDCRLNAGPGCAVIADIILGHHTQSPTLESPTTSRAA